MRCSTPPAMINEHPPAQQSFRFYDRRQEQTHITKSSLCVMRVSAGETTTACAPRPAQHGEILVPPRHRSRQKACKTDKGKEKKKRCCCMFQDYLASSPFHPPPGHTPNSPSGLHIRDHTLILAWACQPACQPNLRNGRPFPGKMAKKKKRGGGGSRRRLLTHTHTLTTHSNDLTLSLPSPTLPLLHSRLLTAGSPTAHIPDDPAHLTFPGMMLSVTFLGVSHRFE